MKLDKDLVREILLAIEASAPLTTVLISRSITTARMKSPVTSCCCKRQAVGADPGLTQLPMQDCPISKPAKHPAQTMID